MRKSSNPKFAKAKKEAIILKYLNDQLMKLNDSYIDGAKISFTDLKLSVDNSYCDVYVDTWDRSLIDDYVDYLNKHAGTFRTYLAKNMSAYKVPHIRFKIDAVVDNVIKINNIFNEINKKK